MDEAAVLLEVVVEDLLDEEDAAGDATRLVDALSAEDIFEPPEDEPGEDTELDFPALDVIVTAGLPPPAPPAPERP